MPISSAIINTMFGRVFSLLFLLCVQLKIAMGNKAIISHAFIIEKSIFLKIIIVYSFFGITTNFVGKLYIVHFYNWDLVGSQQFSVNIFGCRLIPITIGRELITPILKYIHRIKSPTKLVVEPIF